MTTIGDVCDGDADAAADDYDDALCWDKKSCGKHDML